MQKWSDGAKRRLVEVQAVQDAAADMRTIVNAMAKLPPGQLKNVLTEDVIDILEKYGVVIQ